MHRPVLVTAPAILPVSVADAKRHLNETFSDNDSVIEDLIRTKTEDLDGWTGLLGRCLVEQTWRQDFDGFRRCLPLPLGPVISITSVTNDGDTVDLSSYSLQTDAGGRSRVEFAAGVSFAGAMSITYLAGYPVTPEVAADGEPPAVPVRSTVPQDIKTAIIAYVKSRYDGHKPAEMAYADKMIAALLAKYRRIGV